jgi:hypothetical protein
VLHKELARNLSDFSLPSNKMRMYQRHYIVVGARYLNTRREKSARKNSFVRMCLANVGKMVPSTFLT